MCHWLLKILQLASVSLHYKVTHFPKFNRKCCWTKNSHSQNSRNYSNWKSSTTQPNSCTASNILTFKQLVCTLRISEHVVRQFANKSINGADSRTTPSNSQSGTERLVHASSQSSCCHLVLLTDSHIVTSIHTIHTEYYIWGGGLA